MTPAHSRPGSSAPDRLLPRLLVWLLALLVATPLSSGCGSSRRGATLLTGTGGDGLAVHSGALIVNTPASLAIQAALAAMDTTTFPAVQSGPTVRVSGTTTNGTVELDFGSSFSSGVSISGVRMRGTVEAAFNRSGNSASITVTFPTYTGATDELGDAEVGGTLTFTTTLGTNVASGPLTGQASLIAAEAITYTPNETASVTVQGGITTFQLSGSATSVHSVRGTWTLSFGNLQSQLVPQQFVFPGTVSVVRGSDSVTLSFTSQDQGNLQINGGSTQSFDLR